MATNKYIFQRTSILQRVFLVVILALGMAASAVAQDVDTWDGSAVSASLQAMSDVDPLMLEEFYAKGTEKNPWLIQSGADLKYLQKTTDLWKAGIYFLQTKDIDLNNKEWGMIGRAGQSGVNNGIAGSPFRGVYDGGGHTISNGVIYWDESKKQNACGFFGYLIGTAKNMVFDGMVITSGSANANLNREIKLGILAGAIAPQSTTQPVVIENIIIKNSHINDGGYDIAVRALFVGGVVGDVNRGWSSSQPISDRGNVTIRNIYADVNIDLSNTTHYVTETVVDSYYQHNVGGIVGRVRTGSSGHFPTNTIYKGKIRAKSAFVGPVFGAAPTINSGLSDMLEHYYGQAYTITTDGVYQYNLLTTTNNTYYREYSVYDNALETPDYVTFNGNSTLVTHTIDTKVIKVRTLATDPLDFSKTWNEMDDSEKSDFYRYVQGVNHGSCADAASTFNNAIKTINTSLANTGLKYTWALTDGEPAMAYSPDPFILIGKVGNELRASIAKNYGFSGTWTWSWYGVNDNDERTLLAGEISNILDYELYPDYNKFVVSCECKDAGNNTLFSLENYYIMGVVFVYNATQTQAVDNIKSRFTSLIATYNDGNDDNNGATPETAVRTMKQAFKLISAEQKDPRKNIIVVMGYLSDDDFWKEGNKNDDFMKKNVTITGKYGPVEGGMFKLGGDEDNVKGVYGCTVFQDITFYGSGQVLLFYCNQYDVTFDKGVRMENYKNFGKNESGNGNYESPQITIVGGMHNYDNDKFEERPDNAIPGVTTITFKSGCFGRIIASARNNYPNKKDGDAVKYNPNSFNIFGHPDRPHRVKVNVEMEYTENGGAGEYYYGNSKPKDKVYTQDIGLLVGGQTDGSIYVDAQLNMKSGKVGRFIAGNISFGRAVGNDHPSDTFCGSTVLNMTGGDVGELVGGTLGRHDGSASKTSKCEAYFYGRSILNINGGTISGDIYGAGAGGVTGLGDAVNNTSDQHIPYYNGEDANGDHIIEYAPYSETVVANMPKMTLFTEDDRLDLVGGKRNVLDLSKSYCIININGGKVTGSVYGAGLGYSVQIKNNKNLLEQAGTLFGNSEVNITGGTIEGNVYGGGAGHKDAPHNTVAYIYGITKVTMSDGLVKKDVYAGSMGIETKPEMAKLFGKTSVTMVGGTVEGDVYGGSALAKILKKDDGQGGKVDGTGNTTLNLLGGTIKGSVYGGGKGKKENNVNIEANIEGDATVLLNEPVTVNETTTYGTCVVNGSIFGGNNVNGTPQGDVKVYVYGTGKRDGQGDDEFDLSNVYGGGNKANYEGQPEVKISGGSVQQVYGGGREANVASTNVTVSDGTVGTVYGGGYGPVVNKVASNAEVTDPDGGTNVTIRGGKIGNIFGGSNQRGDIAGAINLDLNWDEDKAATASIDSIFGGGKNAPYPKPVADNPTAHDIMVRLQRATANCVFGGGLGVPAVVTGNTSVIIDDNNANVLNEVYGGGAMADVIGNTSVTLQRGEVNDVYGAALGQKAVKASGSTPAKKEIVALVTGNSTVTLNKPFTVDGTTEYGSCVVNGSIFGANNANGTPQGKVLVHVFKTMPRSASTVTGEKLGDDGKTPVYDVYAVYGGGNQAAYVPTYTPNEGDYQKSEVVIEGCGESSLQYVYGGGNAAPVPATQVSIIGTKEIDQVFGGGNGANLTASGAHVGYNTFGRTVPAESTKYGAGTTDVQLYGGKIEEVFGGSNTCGYISTGTNVKLYDVASTATGYCPVRIGAAYSAGNEAEMFCPGTLNVSCADDDELMCVYGGAKNANINNDIILNITGGSFDKVFGGNNLGGEIKGKIVVNIDETDTGCKKPIKINELYAGGNEAPYTTTNGSVTYDDPQINIRSCTKIGSVFGGGYGKKAIITGNPQVNINLIENQSQAIGVIDNVYGGGNAAAVVGNPTVTIGGAAKATHITGDDQTTEYNTEVTIANNIYGGGLGTAAKVTGNPKVVINSGTVGNEASVAAKTGGNVFGGGQQADTEGNTTIDMQGGQVLEAVYGGGALADVSGQTTVKLNSGIVKDVYGGGLGRLASGTGESAVTAIEALVGSTKIELNKPTVEGTKRTFGDCKVLGSIFGANNVNGTPTGNTDVWIYQTVARDESTVTGEKVDANGKPIYDVYSVYGGGNLAAYVPSAANDNTAKAQVTVVNCDNSIETVYGGGNAAPVPATDVKIFGGKIENVFGGGNGAGTDNPGANVGYKFDNTTAYGLGETHVNVHGGKINNLFGGSNTKGLIRVSANQNLDSNVTPPDGAETCTLELGEVYGAGNEADMYCSGKLVCGCVGTMGAIYGGAKNADVGTADNPVDIELTVTSGTFDKVFGGNNLGGTIYGSIKVNIDETGCRPIIIKDLYGCGNQAAYETPAGKKDPEVNVYSCTRIDNVYGGGFGANATVKGNPTVNIFQIPGKFDPDKALLTTPVLDETNVTKLGYIGNVFGGGDQAKVLGNTTVNIATKTEKLQHLNATTEQYEVGANITGNVYGGGNLADVTGKTNVVVGKSNK